MSTERQLQSQVHIPRMTGGGVVVQRDQRLKVITIKGKQIGDLFAFVKDSPEEFISPGQTRMTLRKIYPKVGDYFYSNLRNPLMVIEEDTVGVHDLLAPACDEIMYQKRWGPDNHPSCRGNLVATLKRHEFSVPILPDPHNLFQNTPVDSEGNIQVLEPPTVPGDYLVLQALADLFVVVTACSVEEGAANGGNPSDLMMEVYA